MADEDQAKKRKATADPEEISQPPNGIAEKIEGFLRRIKFTDHEIQSVESEIQSVESEISEFEKRLKEKEAELALTTEVDSKPKSSDELLQQKDHLITLLQQKNNLLQQQKDLDGEKSNLVQKKSNLVQKKSNLVQKKSNLVQENYDLQNKYTSGKYYAFTANVWKVEEVKRNGDEWQSFIRSLRKKDAFKCRYAETKSNGVELAKIDPYNITRNGAQNTNCDVPKSITARSSSMPQSSNITRDAVWPKDIFGRKADSQHIAHLIPAGKSVSHKQWLKIAAAVLGIRNDADITIKKKAARGFVSQQTSQVKLTQESESNSDKRPNQVQKKPGTGVIHFVTNKIRLQSQENTLDGKKPTVLIVPVMTLQGAKDWRGEGYSAICLAGHPRESHLDVLEASSVYKKIGFSDNDLLTVRHTRDANPEELNMACDLLRAAVLALQDMIASLSEDDLSYCENPNENVNKKLLREASEEAKKLLCKVPGKVINHDLGEKPACLITFGDYEDADMHPAPDPLLLVLKAANIFGIMAGMKMLANASSDSDSDVSTGDIIEEEAFLEAREQALRPKTWEDLARGLGQPNGYLASIDDLH
ncbi:hypothetical protein IV203_027334 [Nitzschia inconspicua]|uniref:Uncharacterized protein n=1 Tax=Nitzschia inconspicua TaxID=303405 RepID=A0A9K3LX26_9STRA|nr:hypothetical protein IV203_027334 [Nitzschia inconspicua]